MGTTIKRTRKRKSNSAVGAKLMLPIDDVKPSPENDSLYRPILESDPEIRSLADSLRQYGQKEPIVITLDNFILSGHRRHKAARVAGFETIWCRREPIYRDGNENFVALLREFNRQRVKSRDEQLREEIVSADPEEAHRLLIEHRTKAMYSPIQERCMQLGKRHQRHKISNAKQQFMDAAKEVIEKLKRFWPLSVRQIHYQLLNNPPLIHASKPASRYKNDKSSYRALSDLLTRARYEEIVPFEVIHDPTRPVTTWQVFRGPHEFYRQQMDDLLKGYYRDLLQSQPDHIEIMAEKNTLESIIRPIAMLYCVPLTIGRGYCSTPPKRAMAERYQHSGKNNLILLIVSDFDPDGEVIAESFARSMRDDFGIRRRVKAIKVAVTHSQVQEFQLPKSFTAAKPDSPNYEKFVEKYGTDAYEAEAIEPTKLQATLRQAIDESLDLDAFNAEIDAEKRDAAHIAAVRQRLLDELKAVRSFDENGENLN